MKKADRESLIDLLIHDLTGPLAIVATSVKGLLAKGDSLGSMTPRQRQALERALRNTTKAQNLLHEMIEVYRSDEHLFRKERFPVEELLRQALLDALEVMDPPVADRLSAAGSGAEFLDILGQYGVSVEIKGKYGAAPFVHDEKKIRQIVRNLITNALKYRKERVRLTVTGDDDLIVSVEDDGAGIPFSKKDHVFKRFVRHDEREENKVQGLGFGLSCVKALVESMKGEIILRTGEGLGTCFTVRVPSL